MKKVRKITREYYLRQIVACWLVTCMLFAVPAQVAMALDTRLPTGEVVLPGGGGVSEFDRTSFANQLHIRDVADQTIIEWDTFDIGSSALTEFHQLSDDAAVLNRITTGGASEIFGILNANGRVFIINPAGIVFGSGATVNVAQLVASSLDILNDDFRDGLPYAFGTLGIPAVGDVINEGQINADKISLIGRQVINRGSLVSDVEGGYVIMAAGETVTIQVDPGVSPVSVVVTMPDQTPGPYDYVVDHGGSEGEGPGTVEADHVILAAGDIWSTAIEGVETLRAEAKGNVVFTGDILAQAEPGSDSVADVTIISGGDLVVDYDIEVEAIGDGDFDATASINLTSTGGSVTVISENGETTTVEAIAHDGVTNSATVSITAEDGDATILGPDRVEIYAEAYEGDADSTLNEATVNITGESVKIEANDDGSSNEPVEVIANAHDGETNRATVDIESTFGGVEIIGSDKRASRTLIQANAENGNTNDADVIIKAALGNVSLLSQDSGAMIQAEAHHGYESPAVLNQANIAITGENVYVEAEGGSGTNPAVIDAGAHDGVTNNAGVTIIATGFEEGDNLTEGNVIVESAGALDSAVIKVKAEDGTTNTATVNITANDSVEVVSDGWNSSASITAEAVDGSVNLATIMMTATTGDVQLIHEGGGFLDFDRALIQAKAENLDLELPDEDALALEGLMNTATVTITATEGDVLVTSSGNSAIRALAQNDIEILYDEFDAENSFTVEGLENTASVNLTGANVEIVGVSGDATVEAIARNEIGVDISHYDDDVTVNLDISDLENNATVMLNATDGDVLVQGGETEMVGDPPEEETTLGDALIAAEAYNVVNIDQHTGDWVQDGRWPWQGHWENIYAGTLNLTTNDLTNDALVDIDAANNIKVIADGSGRRSKRSDAIVRAKAYNELVGSDCEVKDVTVNLSAGLILTDDNLFSLSNNADVLMNATNNNVELTALHGGFVSVKADAYNIVEGVEGEIVIGSGGGHGGSDIKVIVEADNLANDALVDIDAGDDLLVTADDGEAEVLAYAWNDIPGEVTNDAVNITNNAQIEIDATNVDVKSTNDGAARVIAEAVDGTTNTAGVTIYADGNVVVMHNDDAEALIEAIAMWGHNNNASIVIDAYANLLVDNGEIGAYAETGLASTATVTVDAANVHVTDGEIAAEADAYFDGTGNALATVDITTTGFNGVRVENGSAIGSSALAYESGNATATTTVTADDGDVIVNDSEITADAESLFGSGNASSSVGITATTGNVNISSNGNTIRAEAEVENPDSESDGDATATVTITATAGDVDIDDYVKAEADAENNAGDATATVNLIATEGSVTIHDKGADRSSGEYVVKADAWVDEYSGDATANLNITAGEDVDIFDDVAAEADTRDNSGNAVSKAEIIADGDVDIYDGFKARSEAVDSGNATADTLITGEDIDLDGWIVNRAITKNNTVNSGDAVGNIVITARGDVDISSGVKSKVASVKAGDATSDIKISGVNIDIDSRVLSRAMAGLHLIQGGGDTSGHSGDATAGVDIAASGIVTIDAIVKSYAEAGNNSGSADATTKIVGTDITIEGGGGGDNESVVAKAETYDNSGDATASVDIDATTGDVIIDTDGYTVLAKADVEDPDDEYDGDATASVNIDAAGSVDILSTKVQAKAKTYTSLYIDTDDLDDPDDDVIDLTVADHVAEASVNITAIGGSVQIIGENDDAGVEAKAKNKVEININGGSFDPDEVTVNLTVEDLTANADVTILANEDVVIEADGYDAQVKAKAKNEFEAMGSEGSYDVDFNLTVNTLEENTLEANANAVITATNGDVEIIGVGGSEAGVEAKAKTVLDDMTNGIDVTETVDNIANNATVNITADGDVTVDDGEVIAEAGAEDSEGDATATVTVNAANLTVDHEGTIEAEAETNDGKADADVGITLLGSDLLLKNGSEIDAEAETEHGEGNATADVTILAANVTVTDGSEIEADAEAEKGAGDATATVDITLTGSDVLVEYGSEISADAETKKGSGDADATVNIVNADNVTVTHDSEIEAEAETEYGSGDATALVDIDADDDVLVEFDSAIMAWAKTYNYDSGNATATVDILAGGSVSVIGHEPDEDGSSKIMAHAMTIEPKYPDSSGSAVADVDINAGGAVTASSDGKIAAVALVLSGDGDSQATALDEPDPEPEIELVITTLPRDATATVDIIAGADVTVEKGSEVVAKAYIENTGMSNHITSLDVLEEIVVVPGDATASVNIDAINVTVNKGSEVYAEAGIYNDAEYPMPRLVDSLINGDDGPPALGNATATVDIDAVGNVTIEEGGEVGAYARIDNYVSFYPGPPTDNPILPILPDLGDATANVGILAGGDVTVSMGGSVYADAELYNNSGGGNNTTAVGSLENGGFELPGLGDATANVEITTPGSLAVDKGGEVYAEASIEYGGGIQAPSIGGLLNGEEVDEDSGDATASVIVDAFSGVTVGERSEIAADAWINSYAFEDVSDSAIGPIPDSAPQGDAFASVDILTCGNVIVDGLIVAEADIYTQLIGVGDIDASPNGSRHVYSGDTSADVLIRAYGDVIVNSEKAEEEELVVESQGPSFSGLIEAVATNGEENSADITILAVGNVIVNDGKSGSFGQRGPGGPFSQSTEEIRAAAGGGHTNDAFIGIATRPASGIDVGGDVIVDGQIGARTFNIDEGGSNTSNVEISAARDVIVNGGYAKYGSVRSDDREREAVQLEGEEGGQIFAGAQSGRNKLEGNYNNTANVKIFAGRDVTVQGAEVEFVGPILPDDYDILANGGDGFYDGGQIIALTRWNDDSTNTSSIGISAQRNVTVEGATITGDPIDFPDTDPFDVDLPGGEILAGAHGDRSTNDADIDIWALENVIVDGDIEATAGTGSNGEGHFAHITIAAGNLLTGSGSIIADADNDAKECDAGVTFFITDNDFDGEAYSTTDHGVTKIGPVIEDFVDAAIPERDFDWIDWLWCEDCEAVEGAPFAPAGAVTSDIWTRELVMILQGCPVEIEAAANELGITPGAMQVSIGNALALNPTLQACDACATLLEAALILRDENGSRMAAMTQMFNDMAPGGSYTPEMQALIATAFAGAAEGSQYASVMEYTDAFIKYYSVLETNLASPVGDSLAFVMDKYGAGVLGSDNQSIATFLAASLESGETFGN